MAGSTLDALPPATALTGAELAWVYQPGPSLATPWIGLRCTTSQIANLLTTSGGGTSTCSMRQLFAAMANQSVMVTAFEALPGDITNSYNIAWNSAYRMTIADPFITGFLEPALGYSGAQMAALFVLANTFPV